MPTKKDNPMTKAASGPAVDPIIELDKRVKTLEDDKLKFLGAMTLGKWILSISGFSLVTAVGCLVYFVRSNAALERDLVANQQAILDLKAALDKTETRLAKHADAIDARLQDWEKRGFRPVMAFFRSGEVVSFKGDLLTLKSKDDGKNVVKAYKVDPKLLVHVDGKDVELHKLKLGPGAAVRFLADEHGEITGLQIVGPKK
jgi:hypothetical protein